VESVAIARALPTFGAATLTGEMAGLSAVEPLSTLVVGPAYFRTLGAPVLAGREFTDYDGLAGTPVAIVNERFASTYWPAENPLGNRLRLLEGKTPGAWLTVVGVAPNISQRGAIRQDPMAYLPYRQKPAAAMEVMARTRVPPATLATAVRRAMQSIDPELPIFGPFTLAERLQGNYWSNGLYGTMFLILAAIALLLASIGLYAVIAHSVSRRTQEIGVRMAIGATARDIRKLVFKQGMLPLAVGLALGLAAAFEVTPILKSFLVEVSPADPVAFIAAPVMLILAAILACLIPARRATRVDPIVALRHE
jgi:predicted permease